MAGAVIEIDDKEVQVCFSSLFVGKVGVTLLIKALASPFKVSVPSS